MNISNYFAVEPLIVQHIKDNVPGLEDVNTPFDIDDMLDMTHVAPSVSVIYYSDRMSETGGRGATTAQYQQWLIVLCMNDASSQGGKTNGIRDLANPFILKLLEAMNGFTPKTKNEKGELVSLVGYREFKRTDCPVTAGKSPGTAYFPFLFEIPLLISK